MNDKPQLEPEEPGLRGAMSAFRNWTRTRTPTPDVDGQLGLFGQPVQPLPPRVKRESQNQLKLWE